MMLHLLLILLGLTSVFSQQTANIRENKVVNSQPQMPVNSQPQTPIQTSTSSKSSPTNQQTKQPFINFDLETIKNNIPQIDIQMPKINIEGHLQGLKSILQAVKQFFISALFYIVIGALIGAIIPFLIFLTLLLLGFTAAGIAAGSLAACCQPPNLVAGSCFSMLQSVGATAKIIYLAPYTAILGAISGLVLYIIKQIFEISITIDFESISKALEQAGQFALATLIDTVIGLLIGIVAPIVIFLCLVGLRIGLTSITSCFEPSSAAKIFRIIEFVKSGVNIKKYIPITAILGACGGIIYSVFFK